MIRPQIVEKNVPGDARSAKLRQIRSVRVNVAESTLAWLYQRQMISDRQFAAGEQLRVDFERAGLGARVTMNWERRPAGRTRSQRNFNAELGLEAIAAKRRFHGAINHAGAGLSDILWRVVCAGEGLSHAENAMGWPSRSAKLVLTLALDRVAEYYKIS